MFAYKGFNNKLQCTRGAGVFQYEVGKWYKEDQANCAKNGFHCCENPLDCLTYYSWDGNNIFCIVEIRGDIHEDSNERISATEIRVVKKLELFDFLLHACAFIQKHPKRENLRNVKLNTGEALSNDKFVVVRGKSPKAAGPQGCYLVLLKEFSDSNEIEEIHIVQVDNEKNIKPNKLYTVSELEVVE